ncbi:trigger factor [Micrococcus lylae]|uniref:Trigger factor n=1 Tax=Micrococcus lylae TaxID=1273 RepID=A0ABY2JYY1_9MICC|nr:trigger factor [Micrococcus lylae]TFH98326.1 trigger factor [Micrococcus lylae]
MVKTTAENLSPTRVKLAVEVPFEEVKPALDKAYKDIADQVQIPGFRKGKVPARLIDQRFGREVVVDTAVNEGLNTWFQQAAAEAEVTPISRPEVDVTGTPSAQGEDPVTFTAEFDVRPEIELPDYKGLKVTVEPSSATEEDEKEALDQLRARFGTLKDVDRPAAKDDFVTMDLTATVDGEQVDAAEGLSYQVGAGTMLEGIDEALDGLSAEEDATFETTLNGGEHDGEKATVKLVLKAVKERELPEVDDEFAQLASEFDTVAELKEDLKKQAAEAAQNRQGVEARDKVLEELVKLVEVPVPDAVIAEQLEQHFNSQGHTAGDDHDTEEHRAELEQNTREAFKNEVILDAVADAEEVSVDQGELIEYIIATASEYGMDPNQFAMMLDQAGQVPMIMGEVRRRKALAKVLEYAKVEDTDGKAVDLTAFVTPGGQEAVDAAEAEKAEEEKPAKKDEGEKKAPAKKPAAKKAPAKKKADEKDA